MAAPWSGSGLALGAALREAQGEVVADGLEERARVDGRAEEPSPDVAARRVTGLAPSSGGEPRQQQRYVF